MSSSYTVGQNEIPIANEQNGKKPQEQASTLAPANGKKPQGQASQLAGPQGNVNVKGIAKAAQPQGKAGPQGNGVLAKKPQEQASQLAGPQGNVNVKGIAKAAQTAAQPGPQGQQNFCIKVTGTRDSEGNYSTVKASKCEEPKGGRRLRAKPKAKPKAKKGGACGLVQTQKRIMYGGRARVVYAGKRGGEYIKRGGEFFPVSKL